MTNLVYGGDNFYSRALA